MTVFCGIVDFTVCVNLVAVVGDSQSGVVYVYEPGLLPPHSTLNWTFTLSVWPLPWSGSLAMAISLGGVSV